MDALTLEKALLDVRLPAGDLYTGSEDVRQRIDQATVNVLRSVVVSGEEEGGFSYDIDKDALTNRIAWLENNLAGALGGEGVNPVNLLPKVKSANRW